MKKFILGLVFAVSSCSTVPSYAAYDSVQCIKFIEGDFGVQKQRIIKDLLQAADRNQAMLVEDLGNNDYVVVGAKMYCEDWTAQQAMELIGL